VSPEPLVAALFSTVPPDQRPHFVVAAGKAASGMLRGARPFLQIERGVLAAHDAETAGDDRIAAFTAGHPAANRASVAAADRALLVAAESAGRGGLLVLLSGGASAMLAAPVAGVGRDEKQETARLLMRAGAAIDELNCVRKHLSRIKGGRLAAAAGSTMTLALSDVHAPVADDPSVIGSGPTVADPTTYADALAILDRYGVAAPQPVRRHLEAGVRGEKEETVKPGDSRLVSSLYLVVGSRQTAADGARTTAAARGYDVVVFPEVIAGEAREAGAAFALRGRRAAADRRGPVCVVGSGETTVTVKGQGKGGRNQEFVLGGALALAGSPQTRPLLLASAGTDGIDGPTDAAGALADATTLARARALGLDSQAVLERNDAHPFFSALRDLIVWGPTGTNVGDLHVLLIG
jgi:glycerate 2-kinase